MIAHWSRRPPADPYVDHNETILQSEGVAIGQFKSTLAGSKECSINWICVRWKVCHIFFQCSDVKYLTCATSAILRQVLRYLMGLVQFLRRKASRLRHRYGTQRYFALANLDIKLEEHLNFDGGFFIEAGANDGMTQSNTLYFELHRNWKGMLIEPIPELAHRCSLLRNRSIVENVALGSFAQRGTSLDMTYCNLMSIADGALPTEADFQKHVASGAAMQRLEPYRLTVPCVPLSDLLDKHGIEKIDFLSLDVEGYEPNVLSGIDFLRHKPRFILIEANRYRAIVDKKLAGHYRVAAQLSPDDVLYASVP
jgi:FkbM family methyltransferase